MNKCSGLVAAECYGLSRSEGGDGVGGGEAPEPTDKANRTNKMSQGKGSSKTASSKMALDLLRPPALYADRNQPGLGAGVRAQTVKQNFKQNGFRPISVPPRLRPIEVNRDWGLGSQHRSKLSQLK